jgi:hypothetical protein
VLVISFLISININYRSYSRNNDRKRPTCFAPWPLLRQSAAHLLCLADMESLQHTLITHLDTLHGALAPTLLPGARRHLQHTPLLLIRAPAARPGQLLQLTQVLRVAARLFGLTVCQYCRQVATLTLPGHRLLTRPS